MSPILGIIASGNWAGANANSYESIATVSVGSGGTSSISFTSIPSTYTHLQIRAIHRSSAASGFNLMKYRCNSDSGSNYTGHSLAGDGSTAAAYATTSQTYGWINRTSNPTAGKTASVFGTSVIDILDYANTSKNKTFRTLAGVDVNGTGAVELCSSVWLSTSAITQIDIYDETANFVQYSTFALYGIKS